MSEFWNFIYNAATATEKESVELRLQGNFIDNENSWIYEWFGIPIASPNAFRKELTQYNGKDISVWIDSNGGSVFAAIGIYNALMEHKKTGSKIKTIADSKVMSAATLPFAAGDERLMSPGAMYMMHNPLTGAQGYASDLRKAADVLDEVKESIMNIYEAATGLSREKIGALMDNETYWGAKTTIQEGFATGMLYSETKGDDSGLNNIMNFSFNRMEIQMAASDSMKTFFEIASKNQGLPQGVAPQLIPVQNKKIKEGEGLKMDPKNVQELESMYPELVTQVKTSARNEGKEEGTKEERTRIHDIEKIANNIDPDLVNKAKFVQPMDAKDLAFEAMQNDGNKGLQYLQNLQTDARNSGANKVSSVPVGGQIANEKPKSVDDMVMSAGARFDRLRRGEKNV